MRTLIYFLLLLSLFKSAFSQQNSVFVVNENTFDTNLEGYTNTAKNIKTEDLIKQKKQFKKLVESSANFGINNDENWIHFELINKTKSSKELVLFLDQSFLEKADFYQYSKDSLLTKIQLNQRILAQNRTLGYPNYVFKFKINQNEQNSIFLRIKSSPVKGISRGIIRLTDENTFHKNFRRNFFSFGILTGFLSLSFFVGLLLFYFERKQIYWIYGVYILTILFFYMSNSGNLNALFAGSFLGSARAEFVFSWLSTTFHIWFIKEFLKLSKELSKTVNRGINVLIFIPLLLVFAYAFLPIPLALAYFSRILTFIYLLLILGLGIWAITKKQHHTLIYSFATFPAILLIIYFLLTTFKVLPLYEITFSLPFPLTVFEIIVFGVGLVYQFNEEKQTIERKLMEERTLVASKIISAQEQERHRISQDLHDDLGSTLSMLKFRLEESNQNLNNQLTNEISITNKAVEDLRQISYNLMPTMFLQRGLVIAVEEFINVNKIASKVAFHHSGKEKRLDNDVELNIFRIIKELLNNAIKHAKATKIELQLIYFEDFLFLSVEDNGIGIKENQGFMKGIGLKNINLRVNYLNGKLNQESSDKGTLFSIEIPYAPNFKNQIATD
jgi:signal transduction histidine kinase